MKIKSVIIISIIAILFLFYNNCSGKFFLNSNTTKNNGLQDVNTFHFFELEFQKDFFPGTLDEHGCYMGGTETRWLVSHK